MSNYSSIKAIIDANIRRNGRRAITGQVLNSVLNAMVEILGKGYQFVGVVTEQTDPGTPDARVFYLAEPGTYSQFGEGITIEEGYIGIISYDEEWVSSQIKVGTPNVVQYIAQVLSETEKRQARSNIGAASEEEVTEVKEELDTLSDNSLLKTAQPLSVEEKSQVWENLGINAIGNEEDIDFDADKKLQFANRSYNSANPDGMGYVILRKNKTFAEQVTEENTIYEIRYDFDLGGASVNIPSWCTLRFNGGSISNGNIVYNNTEIQGVPRIDCVCTGSLRNPIVTPQMYGAKGDGITDDQVALNNAAKYNDSVFIPAGKYNVTEPITLKSNNTLFGVGRESKIRNSVVYGYNKYCVFSGDMAVGTATDSYLTLPSYACTVSSDRLSLEISDTSPFHVGDLIFVYKDENYTTKNPPHFWNAKIVGITTNESIQLDYYIDNDDLVGVNCLVKNMTILPQGSGHYPNVITENVCVHDLTLENIVDEGSGMYVMAIGSYGADIYNIWAHGNIIIGVNYLVNATIRNIVAEFDGGFVDIPEINQNVEICGCRAKRFGSRGNVIGFTMLQGYKAYIHDNIIDIGGNGKIGFGQHIKPIIKNNIFSNVATSPARPIELSSFGNSIFSGNRVSSPVSTAIIHLVGNSIGNIVTDNYIDNPNSARWIEGFTTLDFGANVFKNNYLTHHNFSDVYLNSLPNTRIASFISQIDGLTNKTIAAGGTLTIFDKPNQINNAKINKLLLLFSKGDYTITVNTNSSATPHSRSFNITNGAWFEAYMFNVSSYIVVRFDGTTPGVGRQVLNHGKVSSVVIKNNTAEDKTLLAAIFEANEQ